MTGGADDELEKQGLSDAELRRKTPAHSGLAVWDINVTTAFRTSEMEQHLLYTL